jgi:hypothetical protein
MAQNRLGACWRLAISRKNSLQLAIARLALF